MAPSKRGLVAILGRNSTLTADYETLLRRLGFAPQVERDTSTFHKTLTTRSAHAALVEISPDSVNKLDAIKSLRDKGVSAPCIVITNESSEALAVAALRSGANDYVKN